MAATTATTAGVSVSEPTTGRTTAATSSFTLSEPTDPSTTAASRTTPLESQVAAERQHAIADVKDAQAGQFSAVDDLSHRLEHTQAATEAMFARDLPAVVGAERQADPVGAGMGALGSSGGETIVVPATGQQGIGALGGATLVQTVTVTDGTTAVLPAH